jgi:hypothetical protein
MLPLGMVHQPHDPQRKILHRAERVHPRLPLAAINNVTARGAAGKPFLFAERRLEFTQW